MVNGKLGNGKFTSATIATETRPPSIKSAMWLLERRFPQRRGRQAGGKLLRNAPLLLYSHRPTMGVWTKRGRARLLRLPEESEIAKTRFEKMNE